MCILSPFQHYSSIHWGKVPFLLPCFHVRGLASALKVLAKLLRVRRRGIGSPRARNSETRTRGLQFLFSLYDTLSYPGGSLPRSQQVASTAAAAASKKRSLARTDGLLAGGHQTNEQDASRYVVGRIFPQRRRLRRRRVSLSLARALARALGSTVGRRARRETTVGRRMT